ncbi:MAG: magnesium transporter [Candidatus Woesearchaeota archaeon]
MLREAELIHSMDHDKRWVFFSNIPSHEQSTILLKLSKIKQKHLIEKLSTKQLHDILIHLDPDEVTDILQLTPSSVRKTILKKLTTEIREKVEFLLKFNPGTAASIMSLDYILVEHNSKLQEVAKLVKKHEQRTGKFPEILVDYKGVLLGELKGHDLLLRRKTDKIKKYVKQVPTIHFDASEKEVISLFKKHEHEKVVVLDEQNTVLGLIYSDDVLKLVHKHSNKNLYDLAGVSEEEEIYDGPIRKVKNRYKWLLLHLFTAFLAVAVISFFESTLEALVLLAFYMPVVAGMGGNAGTQTLGVVIRGLALKEITLEKSKKVIYNEIIAGLINGLINGIIVAIVAILWNKNPLLGFILFLAMIFNLIIAGFFGAIVPLILEKFGKDPASSAITFITAATDIFGFLIFLGLASILL